MKNSSSFYTVPKSSGVTGSRAGIGGVSGKAGTVREVFANKNNVNNKSNNNKLSSKSAVTIRKSKSTLPRRITRELRLRLDSTAGSTRRALGRRINNRSNAGGNDAAQKGCQCRVGSGFKAAIYLCLIVGLTGAVGAWLYVYKFGPDAGRRAHGLDDDLGHDLSGGEAAVVTLSDKTVKDSDPDLYLDFRGNIHLVRDLPRGGEKNHIISSSSSYHDFKGGKGGRRGEEGEEMWEGNDGGDDDGEDLQKKRELNSRNQGFGPYLPGRHGPYQVFNYSGVDYGAQFVGTVATAGGGGGGAVEVEHLIESGISSADSLLTSPDGDGGVVESVSSSSNEVVVIYGTTSTSTSSSPDDDPDTDLRPDHVHSRHSAVPTFTVGEKKASSPSLQTASGFRFPDDGDSSVGSGQSRRQHFVTETVEGFLDFVTTVGNTVMVFTPQGGGGRSQAKSESTLTVHPVYTAAEEGDSFFSDPTIGIEGLFGDGFKRPRDSSRIRTDYAEIDREEAGSIRPSSVVRDEDGYVGDGVTALSNGLLEVDGAVDAPKFDRASAEPALQVNDDFRIVSTKNYRPDPTVTQVHSQTLYSDFINGDTRVGVVTSTGGTLIANGVTTVHRTRVVGTVLGSGDYAQVIQLTSEVFDGSQVRPTPAAGAGLGTVVAVTERPSFAVGVAGDDPSPSSGVGSVTVVKAEDAQRGRPRSASSTRLVNTGRKSAAIDDFRSRLKNRYQQFKKSIDVDSAPSTGRREPEQPTASVGRGSVTSFGRVGNSGSRRSFGSRSRQQRQRSFSRDEDEEEEEEVEVIKPTKSFRSRSGSSGGSSNNRRFRDPSRFRERQRGGSRYSSSSSQQDQQEQDLDVQASSLQEEQTSRFGNRRRGGSSRFKNRIAQSRKTTAAPARSSASSNSFRPKRPKPEFSRHNKPSFSSSSASDSDDPTTLRPKLQFKRFNRFSRPDLRQSLLQKILNKGKNKAGASEGTLTLEEQERKVAEQKASALEQDYEEEDVEDALQSLSPEERLQTTLLVSTVYPATLASPSFLEVATIRSPYSFDLDDDSKSTRYITVTRTFTTSTRIKPTRTAPPENDDSKQYKTSTPLFQTETIPAPENILTSSLPDFNPVLDISSSIETLPAVVLASATGITPPLKTVTETFSTKELMLKTSVLPVVINGQTRHHTLTQSYYVTRFVEAVKTVPPMDSYEFIPTKAFTDFNNVLDEAGSEKREHLLPGELEFSDQEDFSEGPHEVRVPPPPGFEDDLKLIGSKFDPADPMEKEHQPEIASQKTNSRLPTTPNPLANPFFNPLLAATLAQQQQQQSFNPLAGLTAEQLQQLALLQYLQNPFGSLAGLPNLGSTAGQPQQQQVVAQQPNQVIQASRPVTRVETVYATNTIPINFGNKKMFTTITSSVGVTTVTEYQPEFRTVAAQPALNQFNPAAAAALPQLPGQLPQLQPSFTVTSRPVVKETTLPSTIYKEIRITFRNTPTLTTLTSTTMVSTKVTEYVTQTVQASPGLNPAAGLGYNPLAALLG